MIVSRPFASSIDSPSSPNTRQKRKLEKDALQELNTRFETLLEIVRGSNFKLTREATGVVEAEGVDKRINAILAQKEEELKTLINKIVEFCADHDNQTQAYYAKEAETKKFREECEILATQKEGEMEILAAKLVELDVLVQKLSAQRVVLRAQTSHSEKSVSVLEAKKGAVQSRNADLGAEIEELLTNLETSETNNDELCRKLAEFSNEALEMKLHTTVKHAVAKREVELNDHYKRELEKDYNTRQGEYQEKINQINLPEKMRALELAKSRKAALSAQFLEIEHSKNILRSHITMQHAEIRRKDGEFQALRQQWAKLVEETGKLKENRDSLLKTLENDTVASRAAEQELMEMMQLLKSLSNKDDIREKEVTLKILRRQIEHIENIREKSDIELREEIDEYRILLNNAEGTFGNVFKQETPPPTPPGEGNPTRGIAQGRHHSGTLPFASVPITPSPKKRKIAGQPAVRISVLDPLFQRVVIENTTNEFIDVSDWALVNTTCAFSQLFPSRTVLPPKGTFTFLPRPPLTKKGKGKGNTASTPTRGTRPPPPGTAYWDFGNRDIQWPMEHAHAVLKDASSVVVDDFLLGQKK